MSGDRRGRADPARGVAIPARRHLVAVWVAAAAVLGALLVFAQIDRSGLDDADPARQRPGFLDFGTLPQPAPKLAEDRPRPGHRMVAFFVPARDLDALCRSVSSRHLVRRADVIIVVAGAGSCDAAPTIGDQQSGLARAYGLPEPRIGRSQVGYAVVDDETQIRYRTLDPAVADDLFEVDTVVRATP